MQLLPDRPRVAGSALTTPHFLLLYAAMLVAAAGNTALQSVMPAIGREIGISDFWVTVSYTWSAVLWVVLAPFWARQSDRHGRKALTLVGVGGFIVVDDCCAGWCCSPGLNGALAGGADLRRLRHLPRALRLARLGHAQRDPGLSRLAHPPLGAGRGAVGAVEQLQPRDDRRPGAGAPVRAAVRRPVRAAVRLRGRSRSLVFVAILVGLPDDTKPRHGRRSGHGAAMSYPSLASAPTGASVIAATRPKGTAAAMERPAHPQLDHRRGGRRPCPGGDPGLHRLFRHRPAASRTRTGRRRRSRS